MLERRRIRGAIGLIAGVAAAGCLLWPTQVASQELYAEKLYADLNGGELLPCEAVRYSVQLTNPVVVGATIEYVDPLPARLGPATITSCPPGGCSYDPGLHRVMVEAYTPPQGGPHVVVEYEAATDCALLDSGAALCNQGTFSDTLGNELLTDGDGDPSNGAQPTCADPPVCLPSFGDAGKTIVDINGSILCVGDEVSVEIVFTNDGCGDATGVIVEDDVDEVFFTGVEVPDPRGSYDGDVVRWDLGPVGVGESVSLSFAAVIQGPVFESACNRATIQAAELGLCDPLCVAETEEVCEQVLAPLPCLLIEKLFFDVTGGRLTPGDRVGGTIDLLQCTCERWTNVFVIDYVDVDNLENTASPDGDFDGEKITWEVGTLEGGRRTFEFEADVRCVVGDPPAPIPDGTSVCNDEYGFSSDQMGWFEGFPPGCLVVSRPVLSLTKAMVSPTPISPGDSVDYEVRICNEGSEDARQVEIIDIVDGSSLVTPPVSIGQGGSWNAGDGRIEWLIDLLARGGPVTPTCETLGYSIQVDPSTPASTQICNDATVTTEDTYASCDWELPGASDCFWVGAATNSLLKDCCLELPCDMGPLYPLPPDRPIPDPPNRVMESGLGDTSKPLCLYEVLQPSPGNSLRCAKRGPAEPDRFDIFY